MVDSEAAIVTSIFKHADTVQVQTPQLYGWRKLKVPTACMAGSVGRKERFNQSFTMFSDQWTWTRELAK
jgi:hypothetical protein